MFQIDPKIFSPEAVSEETRAFNAQLAETLKELPSVHTLPVALTRQAREEGKGVFPIAGPLPGSEWQEIPVDHGPARVRLSLPDGPPKGVYLHIHGGGWTLGAPHHNDKQNQLLAEETGAAVISIQYRLAPEHAFPAGPDDCFAAVKWALETKPYGDLPVVIGGESAGGHLAAVMLLRLREAGMLDAVKGAVLTYGVYDMRMAPSARMWGDVPLILSTPIMNWFYENCLPGGKGAEDPLNSPLLADLRGLVPALFSVGTSDPLLDDTLMMAPRWAAAGNATEVAIHPGGIHAFDQFDHLAIAKDYLKRKSAFVAARFAG